MQVSPRNVVCPTCQASIGAPCEDFRGLHPERAKALKAGTPRYKPKNKKRVVRAREKPGAHTINRLEHKRS